MEEKRGVEGGTGPVRRPLAASGRDKKRAHCPERTSTTGERFQGAKKARPRRRAQSACATKEAQARAPPATIGSWRHAGGGTVATTRIAAVGGPTIRRGVAPQL